MYLLGCAHNVCSAYGFLTHTAPVTPAMAASLTGHLWAIQEWPHSKPPTSYQPVKLRGRPAKIVCSCGYV